MVWHESDSDFEEKWEIINNKLTDLKMKERNLEELLRCINNLKMLGTVIDTDTKERSIQYSFPKDHSGNKMTISVRKKQKLDLIKNIDTILADVNSDE